MMWIRAGIRSVHRVLGTCLALLVTIWFGSGAVLLFVPYPSLNEEERFQRLEPIQLDHCCVPLELVWNQVGLTHAVERVRLFMTSGRPVYVIHFLDGTLKGLWADQGELLSEIHSMTLFVACRWGGRSNVVRLRKRFGMIDGRFTSDSTYIGH